MLISFSYTGNEDVCRLLTCISSQVCSTWLLICPNTAADRGLVDLLHSAAGHASINITSMGLTTLTELSQKSRLDLQFLLPTLQRRAIFPHQFENELLSLSCFHEFDDFRNTVLVEALVACYNKNSNLYMESCISAVEEFCSENSTTDFALQLEAALFCIESATADTLKEDLEPHIGRLTVALNAKAPSLISNPLTLVRMCRTLKMVRKLSYLPHHPRTVSHCYFSLSVSTLFRSRS